MSNFRGCPIPFVIAFVVATTVVAFDYVGALSQRHFFLVSGWMLLTCLVLLGALAKILDDDPISGLRNRNRMRLSLSVVTTTLSLIHINYSTPDSAFEVLLFLLLAASVISSFTLVSRGHCLLLAKEQGIEDSIIAYGRQRYADLRQIHCGILLATIPVTILHGVLSHGHGALSTLISKGTP